MFVGWDEERRKKKYTRSRRHNATPTGINKRTNDCISNALIFSFSFSFSPIPFPSHLRITNLSPPIWVSLRFSPGWAELVWIFVFFSLPFSSFLSTVLTVLCLLTSLFPSPLLTCFVFCVLDCPLAFEFAVSVVSSLCYLVLVLVSPFSVRRCFIAFASYLTPSNNLSFSFYRLSGPSSLWKVFVTLLWCLSA